MDIKKAIRSDLATILHLQKICYTESAERYNDYEIPPLTQTIDELEDDFKKYIILKAVDNNQIIGSIRAYEENNICYINRIFVHPDYQNRGTGKKLILEIEKKFRNVSKYELFTGFKDEKNIRFYKKLNFKIFKEERHSENVKFVFFEKFNQ